MVSKRPRIKPMKMWASVFRGQPWHVNRYPHPAGDEVAVMVLDYRDYLALRKEAKRAAREHPNENA